MDTWDVIGPVCREKKMGQTCGKKQRLWSLWATEMQREISLEVFPVLNYDFHGTHLYLFCNIISGYEIPASLYLTTEILLHWIPCLFSAHSHWAPPLVQWLLGPLRTQFSLPGMPGLHDPPSHTYSSFNGPSLWSFPWLAKAGGLNPSFVLRETFIHTCRYRSPHCVIVHTLCVWVFCRP